ncbi:MAG: rRNA maturation RNase YbeY [Clostridiales bacterium]|jgi:probable rRNA maturation factor|nr:rRNA maturation RNase YbeY [Clostridiales bacterium]
MAKIYFSNETDYNMAEYEPVLKGIIEESLNTAAGFSQTAEISVTFMDNKAIRGLNQRYRHVDSSTDVLSFPMYNSWCEWPDTGQAAAVGDIVISVERAEAQSKDYGHSFARELGFLTAHSMLHLMGYDHTTPEGEEKMCGLQEEILMKAGLPR